MINTESSKNWLISAIAKTFLARAGAALGSFLLVSIVAGFYGAETVGVFAISYSIILGLSVLTKFGKDSALMKYIGQDFTNAYIKLLIKDAFKDNFLLSVIFSLLIYFSRHQIQELFHANNLDILLIGISLSFPAFTHSFLLSGFYKGIGKPATACLVEHGSIALLAAIIIVVSKKIFDLDAYFIIGYSFAFSAWFVAIFGTLGMWLWIKANRWSQVEVSRKKAVLNVTFSSSSFNFFIINASTTIYTSLSIMILGQLLLESDVGLYMVSERISTVIVFILIVMNAVIPPKFAKLNKQMKYEELEAMAKNSATICTFFSIPILVVFVWLPDMILGLFGLEFVEASPILVILCLAQLCNVLTGSVGYMLTMTGHDAVMRNITIFCNFSGLFILLYLVSENGLIGAAWAYFFVIFLLNFMPLILVKKYFGFWALPDYKYACLLIKNNHMLTAR